MTVETEPAFSSDDKVADLSQVRADKAEREADAKKAAATGGKVKLRRCAKCREKKPLEDFGSNSSSLDGYQTYCKSCRNGLHKARRERDPVHRIRHHFVTRMTKQLGYGAPRDLFSNIEGYLGYKLSSLVLYLDNEIKQREGISLREALKRGYHIDHKYPLSKFDVTSAASQAFRDCWAMENLWAIPADVNLAKSNKIVDLPDLPDLPPAS